MQPASYPEHGANFHAHLGWMPIWWVVAAAIIAVVAWAVISAARGPKDRRDGSREDDIEQRFANGEIDRETYRRMLTDLRST